jgi:hypothetical protein
MARAKLVALTVLVIFSMVAAACGTDEDAVPTRLPTDISESQESKVIRDITDYNEVTDATLLQEGISITLAIVVGEDLPVSRAKELGEQFVRLFKIRSPDVQPGGLIGAGKFEYSITVSYPDEEIARGVKPRLLSTVVWK